MIRDLPLDAIEAVNNAGFFSAPYNAWRRSATELMLRSRREAMPTTSGMSAAP